MKIPKRPRIIVTAWRGSGGALNHLAKVVGRLPQMRPDWRFDLYAPAETLTRVSPDGAEDWLHEVDSETRAARLQWEFVDLPALMQSDSNALLFSPFGPLLNLSLVPRAIWMPQNIVPLLDFDTREVSEADVPRNVALRYLFVSNARLSRSVVCVSKHGRQRIIALAGIPAERVHAVHHGVDAPAQVAAPAHPSWMAPPYVLHLGQLTPYRRTVEVVRGYAELAERRRDVPRLVIAGEVRSEDREYGARCMEELRPLIAEGRAVFAGRLTHPEALAAIARAHTIVYPSVHEDCPNTVLEALAAGRVSVLADIPATRELADQAAILVPDPGPHRLAEALERAIFDAALRETLEQHALRRAAGFTWSRSAEELASIFDHEIETHGPSDHATV
jgi:glycosyltransferase involved in cell wall biosynthesis